MIKDGATGTAAGDGLKQTLSESHATDVSMCVLRLDPLDLLICELTNIMSRYYKAARIYNSGSIAASGKLEDGIATHCYASDIANRLTGWVRSTFHPHVTSFLPRIADSMIFNRSTRKRSAPWVKTVPLYAPTPLTHKGLLLCLSSHPPSILSTRKAGV